MTITSHHFANLQHASLTLHHSEPAGRLIPAPAHLHLSNREHGTRVTVHNLFGNMPVRVKQRALESLSGEDEKHLATLKRQIVGLLMAWHVPVTVCLKSAKNSKDFRIWSKKDSISSGVKDGRLSGALDVSLICSILSQAGYIEPSDWGEWIKTSARTPFITIKGAISMKPAPNKQIQFLSLGIRPMQDEMGSNVLYEEVNRLFAFSSFGIQEEIPDTEDPSKAGRHKDERLGKDGFTSKQLRGGGKGVDRWPMFYIRIEIDGANTGQEDDIEKLGKSTMTGLVKVLGAMITEFLSENHYRPRARPGVRRQQKTRVPEAWRESPGVQNKRLRIALPNQMNVKHEDDTFSTWGRIKSGLRVKSSGDSSSLSSLLNKNGRTKIDVGIAASPENGSNPALNVGDALTTGDGDTTTDIQREKTVEWQNPISGAIVLVNARTGLVVSDRLRRRPATAPSRVSSDIIPTFMTHHVNAPPSLERRSMRTLTSVVGSVQPGSWSSSLLKSWENPVFDVTEEAIPQVTLDGPSLETSDILHGRRHCCSDGEIQKAFTQSSLSFSAKLSRQALKEARIISQVDHKFILTCFSGEAGTDNQAQGRQILVLVDQHAADERIRVEALLAGLGSSPTLLAKPIIFEISEREHTLFARHSPYFSTWGFVYSVSRVAGPPKCRVSVQALPAAIAERCRIEPKVLIDLLRGEAWKREELGAQPRGVDQDCESQSSGIPKTESWLARLSTCPQGLLDMLNSRACRSAIMFNDKLTKAECKTLIERLSECVFPFQCAHGRPSMIPIVDVGSHTGFGAEKEVGEGNHCGIEDLERPFGKAWKAWRPREEEIGEQTPTKRVTFA